MTWEKKSTNPHFKPPQLRGSQKWDTYSLKQLEYLLKGHSSETDCYWSPERLAWLKWKIAHYKVL